MSDRESNWNATRVYVLIARRPEAPSTVEGSWYPVALSMDFDLLRGTAQEFSAVVPDAVLSIFDINPMRGWPVTHPDVDWTDRPGDLQAVVKCLMYGENCKQLATDYVLLVSGEQEEFRYPVEWAGDWRKEEVEDRRNG